MTTFLRAVLTDYDAEELLKEIHREFAKQRDVEDLQAIKYLLSDGRTKLKQLQEVLGMAT